MLHLDMLPADDANQAQLIERDSSGLAAVTDERHPVQEIEP